MLRRYLLGFSALALIGFVVSCSAPPVEEPPVKETAQVKVAAPVEASPATLLADIDEQLAQSPQDPMLHYRRAQLLARIGRYDECEHAARKAMAQFSSEGRSLAWMGLETVELASHHVDIHFNMGPRERIPPESGIARPYSFRVWTKDRSDLVDTIDFEIGYLNSKPISGAFGQTHRGGHRNLGSASPSMNYSQIRVQGLEIIAARLGT